MKRRPLKKDRGPGYLDAVEVLSNRRSFMENVGKLALGLSVVGTAGEALAGLLEDPKKPVKVKGKRPPRLRGVVRPPDPPGVDGRAVRNIIKRRHKAIKKCYQDALKKDPKIQGQIVLQLRVKTTGRARAMVLSNDTGSSEIGACLVKRLESWRYPKAEGEPVTVKIPFIFKPDDTKPPQRPAGPRKPDAIEIPPAPPDERK